MAPLISVAAATAGFETVAHIGSQITGGFIHNIVREAVYEANKLLPTAFPEPPEIIQAYLTGNCTEQYMQWALSFHGIDYKKEGWTNEYQQAWWRVIDTVRPAHSPEKARWLYWVGWWGRPDAHNLGQALTTQDARIPFPAEKQLYWHLRRHGLKDIDMAKEYMLAGEPLTLGEYMVARNRGIIDQDQFTAAINGIGVLRATEQIIANELLKEIPGPSEIVHFVLRHGFEPSVIRANRLDEEFPDSAREWLGKQGFNYEFSVTDPFTGEVAKTTWADMYWQTHWVPISPGQAYTMLQRIRDDNIDEWRRTFPGINPFTLDDVRRWLRINDYPPGIRDYLAAISYTPIGRRDIQRAFRTGSIAEKELPGLWQNLGYSPKDAQRLAEFTIQLENERKFKLIYKETQAKVKKAYQVGTIGPDDLRIQLFRLTLENPQELLLFDAQPRDMQLADARNDPEIEVSASAVQADSILVDVEKWTKLIYQRLRSATISLAQAQAQLRTVGVVEDKIQTLMNQWSYELQSPRKELLLAKVLSLFTKGLIPLDQALMRMVNMGYSFIDANYMIAEAQVSAQIAAGRQQKQQLRDADAAQRQLVAQQRAAKAAARDAQAQLAKYGTPTKLVKWYSQHLIELPEMESRLGRILTNPADLRKWVEDAISKRQEADKKKSAASAKRGRTTTQSTTAGGATPGGLGTTVPSGGVPTGGGGG